MKLLSILPNNRLLLMIVASDFQPKTLIRLSGGGNNFEGRVEVFHDKRWGTISTSILNFNEKEAQVVCNQLGIDR